MSRRRVIGAPAAVLVMLAVISVPALAQVRSPYIQQVTPNSVSIIWQAETRGPGVVCYGTETDALDGIIRSDSARTTHILSPSGLAPHTRYYYSAGEACDSVAAAEDFFTTAPLPGSSEPFRAWIVGDSGTGGPEQLAVRDAMLEFTATNRPDLFLHMGDMAYSAGRTTELTSRFFDVYAGVIRNTPCWPTMGNHEGISSNSASQSGPYYDAYVLPTRAEAGGVPSGTEAYYSYDYANAHFVVLESYETDRDPDGAMLTWLQEDLAATAQEWIIAYWHHPPYSKGSHDSDVERRLINMRENALPILESAGVDLVISGHSHVYERSYLLAGGFETPSTRAGILDVGDGRSDGDGAYQTTGAGTVYIVAGHGGTGLSQLGDHPVMYFADTQHGSNILDVDGSTLTVTNLLADGSVNDIVTIDKSDGLNLLHPRAGDTVLVDSVADVRWTTRGGSERVHIDYSLDGGLTWYRAGANTANDGQFDWVVPVWPTEDAWLRVRAVDGVAEDIAGPFSIGTRSDVDLIRYGAVWEYSDRDEVPPSSWRTSSGGWRAGPGQLGYGEGDEATVLRDELPKSPSVYFRSRIEIEGDLVSGIVRVLFDDGYVLWINGVEVARENVDSVAHASYSTASSSDDQVEVTSFEGALVNGVNDIAVLVKQRSTGSSDLSFDLALSVTLEAAIDPRPPSDPLVETLVPDPAMDVGAEADADDVGPDAGSEITSDAAADGTDGRTGSVGPDTANPQNDVSQGADTREDAAVTGQEITVRGSGCATTPERIPPLFMLLTYFALPGRRKSSHQAPAL